MNLGVPYSVGFQSSSSVVGETMVHVYEYMMILSVLVFMVLATMLFVGIYWFKHLEYKNTVEVLFVWGEDYVGQANWKVINCFKMARFQKMKKSFLFLKPRILKQLMFYYLQCAYYDMYMYQKNKNFGFDTEVMFLGMTDFFADMAREIYDIVNSLIFSTRLSLLYYYQNIVLTKPYKWMYYLLLFSFLKVDLDSLQEDAREQSFHIMQFWASRSVVQRGLNDDVVLNSDMNSGHMVETESYYERNLNVYWYSQSKISNVSLESFWSSLPGLPLFMVWLPTSYLVAGQNEIMESALAVKVVGKQWFWFYEMVFMKPKPSQMMPEMLHNFEFKGMPAKHFAVYLEKWSLLSSLEYKSLKFKSKLVLAKQLSVGQLRLFEVDKWLVLRVNKELQMLVAGLDVIHSFGVQGLGCKMDAVPGRVHGIVVFLKRAGKFFGQCSELCGIFHGYMPMAVQVGKNYNWSNFLFGSQRS